ncbi:MAG: BolA/IbaG family iron-sulfur metabolism protein [Gammaproteobacteria bacterium]|nr:BolA/IbaG family iron-sulfur metabolism protein [Gammaproteobacteria bacterium]
MDNEAIKNLIEAGIPGARADVTGDGCSVEVTVTSNAFEGLSLLMKQQLVMATVKAQIESGELHAISIKTHTI